MRSPPRCGSGFRVSSVSSADEIMRFAMELVRIDKWLWAARFFKTRTAATDAVLGGRVHVNGVRVKPSREIRAGDTIDVTIGTVRRTAEVLGLSTSRGPARVAATLYTQTQDT